MIIVCRSLFFTRSEAHGIVNTDFSGDNVRQFALDQLFADAGNVVDKHPAVQMVAFMLHNTGKESADFLLMRLEILIEPAKADMLHTWHLLGYTRQTKAALRARYGIAVEHFDLGVDEHKLAAGTFGERLGERVGIDHHNLYVLADLRGRQADALGFIHGLEHEVYKFLKTFERLLDRLRYFAEHGVTVAIHR